MTSLISEQDLRNRMVEVEAQGRADAAALADPAHADPAAFRDALRRKTDRMRTDAQRNAVDERIAASMAETTAMYPEGDRGRVARDAELLLAVVVAENTRLRRENAQLRTMARWATRTLCAGARLRVCVRYVTRLFGRGRRRAPRRNVRRTARAGPRDSSPAPAASDAPPHAEGAS
jgi:hypothetical protein